MSEIAKTEIAPRPALAHPPLGAPGASLRMSALPEGHVLQALVGLKAVGMPQRLVALGDGGSFAVRPLAPGQWFVVGNAVLSQADFKRKAADIADIAALSDQSGGRVRIALGGRAAETILSRGTAVDVSRSAFRVGHSAQTLFKHIGVHLTRVAEDEFEMMVLRSFAESLWDDLAGLGEPHFSEV